MEKNNKITIYHQLTEVYDDLLLMDSEEIEEVSRTLKGINFEEILNYFVDQYQNDKLDDMDIMTIRKIIDVLQFIYNNTDIEPPVSDNDYDRLYQVLSDVGVEVVGAVNAQGKPVREHKYPDLRGTLNKVHFMFNMDKGKDNRRSVEDWIVTIENILGYEIDNSSKFAIHLQPKWDGVSVVFECDGEGCIEHALLRGDTSKNLAVDIKALFEEWLDFKEFVKDSKRFGVKTEVLMNRADYVEICKNYKVFSSPRSATTSIVNEKVLQPHLGKYLTVEKLRIQYEGEQPQLIVNERFDMSSNLGNMKEIQFKIGEINTAVREEGLSTDGVVMYLLDPRIQQKLGRDGAINRFEVAFKFPAEEKVTKLLDVVFSTGLGGNITPVAKVEPVVMRGNTIRSISLGSPERFLSLDLREGQEVLLKYEIIPYLDVCPTLQRDENAKQYIIPTHCKYCGMKLEKDPVLKCVNESCPSRIIGNVVNYINKMRIENINFETISEFFDMGIVKGIESLYELDKYKDMIVNTPGYGEKSYSKMIEGINNRKECFDYELLGSLGIPNLGERMFKKVLKIFTFEEVLEYAGDHSIYTRIIGFPGFGEKMSARLQEGLINKLKTIDYLRKIIKIKPSSGKTAIGIVCFTKIRDDDFANKLMNKGYEVSDSLTKETTHLIVPSYDTTSGKIERAKKYGTIILTLDDAIKTL